MRKRGAVHNTEKPNKGDLPDYPFDVHTRKGRSKGKTKADFFADEFAALQPRDQGEFDWCIDPNARRGTEQTE